MAEDFESPKEAVAQTGILATLTVFDLISAMYEGISKRISNPHLRDMLSYFVKYVGSSPYSAPAVLNMMIYMQHAQGCWYVTGGMHKLAEGLERLAREEGVQIHTGINVVRALTSKDGLITGIELEDGSFKTADYYASNI